MRYRSETFNIDITQIESKITERTKAILPVHLFGLAADMGSIVELANKYNLFVVEDAVRGFGAKYKGRHAGTFGNTGCFSFHPRKAITTGEGGMVTTNDDGLCRKIRRLRDHGAAMTDLQRHLEHGPYLLADHPDAGYNQRMTDLQAAIGSAQMDRAYDIVFERQALAKKYDDAFANLDWLRTPFRGDDYEHGYQSYPCIFMPKDISLESVKEINAGRNQWMDDLQKAGISTLGPQPTPFTCLVSIKRSTTLCLRIFPMHMRLINVAFPSHFFME